MAEMRIGEPTSVLFPEVVSHRLLIDDEGAKLHDVAAHVVREVVACTLLH